MFVNNYTNGGGGVQKMEWGYCQHFRIQNAGKPHKIPIQNSIVFSNSKLLVLQS